MRQQDLQKTLGITRQRLREWLDRGLPHAKRKPRRGRHYLDFDPQVVRQWLLANGLATTGKQAGPILLTRDQVAEHFGVHIRTVAEWLARGCPGSRGQYDVEKIAAWKTENIPDGDPLLTGPQSDALEEYRRWKAKREQFAFERDQQQWIRRDEIHEGLMLCISVIRQAVDTLQRKFGPEARAIMAEAIEDALASYHQTYADRHDPPPQNAHAATAPRRRHGQ